MCIECKAVEHYVPSSIQFLKTKEKKWDCGTIPKLDSEESDSEDSVTMTITGTEIISSSQPCKDVSDCKYAEKSGDCKKKAWFILDCSLIDDVVHIGIERHLNCTKSWQQ